METMSPQQQENINQLRSLSLTGDSKTCATMDNKRRMKTLSQRRQSAPSLVISKALTRSRTMSRENCLSPVSPETCLLVQSYSSPSRMFISHVYAQLKTGLQTQERHLFLFSDILLFSKAKSSTNFKLKTQARLCEMWTANCMEEVCEGSSNPDKSFVMGWPTYNCVVTFCSVEQKEKWLSLIKSRIREEKEKENPKTIPLKVFAKDIGNCGCKTIAVSNSDSATEVIRLTLQQFGISGCVKDYQLWVSSRKDNAPYPLIGHEFPFSIQMSHIRDSLAQSGVKSDALASADEQADRIIELLQSDNQCQFILKPSRVAVGQSFVVDHVQKPFKRRRSLINWAFWRGSTNQLDDPPLSPLLPAAGQLFGLPLSAVCKDNTLPKPIMEMLVFLFQEGPFTRGIFRRSAGAKACRELRERLDSGNQDMQLIHHSIFVIAAVFKDFLRNIPGSLLSSELYEKWISTMDCTDEGNGLQLEAIQRLITSLPPENILLLKHVLSVLYSIQLRAHENQMNAFNLAVCIAPSLLTTPAHSSPEIEGEGTKKVCNLVQVMIERCQTVLGEDVTSLFASFPQRCTSNDHGSDVSSYQMTDSSYDSLENELNDDSGSPFQLIQRQRGKQDSRSRDSVLTLSDCDLDQPDTDIPLPTLLTPLVHPVKAPPAPCPSSPCPLSLCEMPDLPQGVRQLRRRSEPAIWNASSSLTKCLEHLAIRKGSYDGATQHDQDGVDKLFVKQLNNLRLEKQGHHESSCRDKNADGSPQRREQPKPPPLRLDISCSSLYSPGPSPTRSSMSSVDSAFSQHSSDLTKPSTHPGGNLGEAGSVSPRSPGNMSLPLPGPVAASPRSSPPKETFDWSLVKASHGLHPNTWLKRGRRLSLTRDKIDWEDGDMSVSFLQSEVNNKQVPNKEKKVHEPGAHIVRGRSISPPSYQQALLQNPYSKSIYYTGLEKPVTVRELRELHNEACSANKSTTGKKYIQKSSVSGTENSALPQALFYGQSAQGLSLYRQKSHSLLPITEKTRENLTARRASEPGGTCLGLDRESTRSLEHLHRQVLKKKDQDSAQEHGVKISDVEPHGREPRFCLSPAATKAVRDYFSWHGGKDTHSTLKNSQEVTIAVVQGKREWLRRCSDPRLEDFEQMLFAEESYV